MTLHKSQIFWLLSVCLSINISAANSFAGKNPPKVKLPWREQVLNCQRLLMNQTMEQLPKGTDAETIQAAIRWYPEMLRLVGKVNATPEGLTGQILAESPSKKMFGEQHIEFDRTAVGLLSMKWVLAGEYDQFTKPHAAAAKLSRENFEHLKAYTESILKTSEDVDAMVAYMVINDLGKIDAVVKEIERLTKTKDVDHDKILLTALKERPAISPSFNRLSERHKHLIIKGLEARFNIGQFIQGENAPASLMGLKSLDRASLDFYLLHAVFDIAGAAGHVNPSGAVVMTEPTYQGFRMAIDSITRLAGGENPKEVYDSYLAAKGKAIGLGIDTPFEKAALRISLMLRASTAAEAQEVVSVMQSLPKNAQAILVFELNVSGVDDGLATVLYYSPATLANARAALTKASHPDSSRQGLEIGLLTFARLFQESRIAVKGRNENGVFTVNVAKIAEGAKAPKTLTDKVIQFNSVGNDAEAVLVDRQPVDAKSFPGMSSLNEIPGKRVVIIGIGGGSDGIQAAQLAKLMMGPKEIPCVISVRSVKPTSQGASNKVAESRTIQNHGGEVVAGVYRVKRESTGSGRFLENLPADELPVYLVIDEQNGTLASRIQAAIRDAGGTDTIVAVDTGGDALYGATVAEGAKATPDQDLRVLRTLGELKGVKIVTAEIAVGVDSPPNAQQVLAAANASYYSLSPNESAQVIASYKKWKMDGTDETRFGKTPLAWQMALQGAQGVQVLPLPTRVVLDSANPWNPFVPIDQSMQGIFFMDLDSHLGAISR